MEKIKFISNESILLFFYKTLLSTLTDLSTPLSFFNYFFDDKILNTIVEQTNLFSNNNEFTKNDILKYLGIFIYTSVMSQALRLIQ